jgi:hypothetical protein
MCPTCRILAVSALLASLLLLSPTRSAEEKSDWTDLTNLSVWEGTPTGWALADQVRLDEKNPRKLTFTEGKSILVNGKAGRARDLVTRAKYGDHEVHLEFVISKGSNSGVKFHALYEIQIYDSYGKTKKLTGADCGGVYPRAEQKPVYHYIDEGIPPSKNACRAPGEWQTLDAIFLAPRFDAAGKKTASARLVKVVLNGTQIHDDVELKTPTGHNWTKKEMATGPLLLQGDHGPVAFRNVRVRPYTPGR